MAIRQMRDWFGVARVGGVPGRDLILPPGHRFTGADPIPAPFSCPQPRGWLLRNAGRVGCGTEPGP